MTRTPQDIRDWLVARVSTLTGVPPGEIDPAAPLARHGLDSVALIALAADLEGWLGHPLHENPLERYPTIDALADFLSERGASAPARDDL